MRPPYSAERLLVITLNSPTASIDGFTACASKPIGPPEYDRVVVEAVHLNVHLVAVLRRRRRSRLPSASARRGSGAVPAVRRREAEIVPAVQRHLHDALIANHLADGGGFRIEQRGRGGDLDRFGRARPA